MKFLLICSCLLFSCFAHADSLIRIDCQANADGARVFVDGQYQFDCEAFENFPVPLSAGTHEIRAVKSLDAEFEKVFRETVELQAGIPRRVRVELPAKTLTEFGLEQKRLRDIEKQQLAEERRAQKEQARLARQERKKRIEAEKLAKTIEQDRLKAASGDRDAMGRMADRYRNGVGVEQDIAKANELQAQIRKQSDYKNKIAELQASKWRTFTDKVISSFNESNPNPGSSDIVMLTSTVFPTIYIDAVSSPATTTQNAMVDSEIEELRRAAAATSWARPDSLIAQALMRD